MRNGANNLYEFGGFRLDAAHGTLWRGTEIVPLSPKALEVLAVLIERNGQVVSKQEIFQTVWADTFVEDGVLTQNIYTLRNALGPDENGKQFIETVPRRGYRFAGEVIASSSIVDEQEDLDEKATETNRQFSNEFPSGRRNSLLRPLLFTVGIILSVAALWIGAYEVFIHGRNTRATDPAPIEQVRLRRLTDSGDVIHPTISPNGEMLAYVRQEEHGEGLWIKQIATGNSIQTLPLSSKGYRSLTFSPDASYLFFRELATPASIYQTSTLFGTPKKVADNVWSDFSVSPDGRQFAFMRRDAERNAYLLILSNIDGSGERELSLRTGPSNYSDIAPAWSPDGAKLVVVAASEKQIRPQLMSIDTVTGQEVELKTPGWRTITRTLETPDGKHLVVAARAVDEATSQLWMLDLPDGTVRRLTNDLEAYFWLSMSADGRMLVTRQQEITAHLWILPDGEIHKAKQLTIGERNLDGYRGLEWTVDGRIIFTALVGQVTDLYSIDADGSNKVQLTANAGADNTYPATSTDGRYIIFTSQRTGMRQIWRMDADGRNQKQLTFGRGPTEAAYAGELSSDGTEVFFIKQGAGPSAIWKVSIDGGAPVPVSRLTNATAEDFLSMSPDGKWLAFRYVYAQRGSESDEQTMRIGVLAADGSGEPRFFDLPISRPFVHWSSEGTLDYAAGTFKSATITRQTVNGGDPKKLVDFPDRVFDFAWSPDGKNLAVSRGRVQGDAVLITNLP